MQKAPILSLHVLPLVGPSSSSSAQRIDPFISFSKTESVAIADSLLSLTNHLVFSTYSSKARALAPFSQPAQDSMDSIIRFSPPSMPTLGPNLYLHPSYPHTPHKPPKPPYTLSPTKPLEYLDLAKLERIN
ncbi:hypothetical protein VNO78_22436 [Psophocarpus tetragonolobus]|uniref:Uncharacterized protein n=1 Tax=Psophocarpus tetragonolobus TaxID=3891 RepID=A0AAN9S1M4_PSOTE